MFVRRGKKQDILDMDIQKTQTGVLSYVNEMSLEMLINMRLIWTITHKNKILCVCGLNPQWENRAIAWAILSQTSGKHYISIHKIIKRLANRVNYRRIEAMVDVDFKQAHRWVKLLGFEPEGYMKAYTPEGKDQILYSRIRI